MPNISALGLDTSNYTTSAAFFVTAKWTAAA